MGCGLWGWRVDARRLTRGGAGLREGSLLSHAAATGCPERATHTSPGQHPGGTAYPPIPRPLKRVGDRHLCAREALGRSRLWAVGCGLWGWLVACVSVHARTGLACGGTLARRSDRRSARCRCRCQWPRGSGVTVVIIDGAARSPAVERTRCQRRIGALPTDRGSTATTTTARRVGHLADHDNGSGSAAPGRGR